MSSQGEIQSNPLAKAARIPLKRTALPTFEWTIKHFRGEFHLDLRCSLHHFAKHDVMFVAVLNEMATLWRRDLSENSTINNRSRWYTPWRRINPKFVQTLSCDECRNSRVRSFNHRSCPDLSIFLFYCCFISSGKRPIKEQEKDRHYLVRTRGPESYSSPIFPTRFFGV